MEIRGGMRVWTTERLRRIMEIVPEVVRGDAILLAVDAIELDDLSCLDPLLYAWQDPNAEGIMMELTEVVRQDLGALGYRFHDREWNDDDTIEGFYTTRQWGIVIREA